MKRDHFYARIKGGREMGSRVGSKRSGIWASLKSKAVEVEVSLSYDSHTHRDLILIKIDGTIVYDGSMTAVDGDARQENETNNES